jgi:hypothetical protein
MPLRHRGQGGEETERHEGQPVARDGHEVLPRGDEYDGRDEEARREVAPEGAHVRVRELHGPFNGYHGRREEQRGQKGVAQASIGEEHGEGRPPRDVRALHVQEIDADHADQDARDAQEIRLLLERDIAQAHEDEEAHLPQGRHHGDGGELERLGQGHGRDDLADGEEKARPHEARLDDGHAVPDDEERGERQEKRESSPHRHVLVQLVSQALHHRVPQHLAECGGEREGYPHAREST